MDTRGKSLAQKWKDDAAIRDGMPTTRELIRASRAMRAVIELQKKLSRRMTVVCCMIAAFFLIGIGFDVWYFKFVDWGYVASALISAIAAIYDFLV